MPTPAELAVDKRIANIEINDTLSNISAYRQREWLLRSQLWLNLPQAEWMGGKVLGKGSCGIVGRFDYQGKNPKVPRSIAIKQTAAERSRHALSRESKFLRILTATENPHIVKLYKGYHQEGGSGTLTDLDPLPFQSGKFEEVARIYLEFVPAGDAKQFLKDLLMDSRYYVIPEEKLWRMMDCLARAMHVLQFGHDDPEQEADPKWKRSICHFDVKPANILIGEQNSESGDHHFEIFKLADFGLSLFDRSTQMTRSWNKQAEWRGTPIYQAPEQHFVAQEGRSISCQTNVWGIGVFMLELITKKNIEILKWFDYTPQHTGSRDNIRVSGSSEILCNTQLCPYSSQFIEIICRALAHRPDKRITATELLKETNAVVKIYNQMNEKAPRIPRHDPLRGNNFLLLNKLPTNYMQRFVGAIPKTEDVGLISTYIDDQMQAKNQKPKESPNPKYSTENSFGPTWLSTPPNTKKEEKVTKSRYRYQALTETPDRAKRAAPDELPNPRPQKKKPIVPARTPSSRSRRRGDPPKQGLNRSKTDPTPQTNPTPSPWQAPRLPTRSYTFSEGDFNPLGPGGAGRHNKS